MALPGVRSTEGNYPFWLSVDNRMIADEYMRPSYTSGIQIRGEIVKKLTYSVMLGNNMSTLGVDAGQIDNKLSTIAGRWFSYQLLASMVCSMALMVITISTTR